MSTLLYIFYAHHSGSSSECLSFVSPMHQPSAFTPGQCQQLLALFGASNSSLAATPQASEAPMADVASSSNFANVAMAGIDFSQCLCSTSGQ